MLAGILLMGCVDKMPAPELEPLPEPEWTAGGSWPVEIDCEPGGPEAPELAVRRAVCGGGNYLNDWMQGDRPHFDAAIGVSAVNDLLTSPSWRAAELRALEYVASDANNLMRVLFDDDFEREPDRLSNGWAIPAGGKVPVDFVLIEAAHCADLPWREATSAYVCGPMRDQGGYETAHGLWAFTIAADRDCPVSGACVAELARELAAAQPASLSDPSTLDVDLFAERMLMVARAEPALDDLRVWGPELMRHQRDDGGFYAPAADEKPYYAFHATMAASWALAEWYRREREAGNW